MSRCFPFPPPGYEKKARTECPDFLKKEKQREKKRKKEKDKERRESKEKKDKDRSDEKNREKKDKKEKHREKKKEDRSKDKDKSRNSDEKKFSGQSEVYDGEKTSNDIKFPGKFEVQNAEKFSKKRKEKGQDRSSYSGEKKISGQLSGYSVEKHGQNSYLVGDTRDSNFMQGVGRRHAYDDRPTGNQLVEKFPAVDRKRDESMVRLVAKATSSMGEGKEKRNKRGDGRKFAEEGVRDEGRVRENVMVQNISGIVQTRIEGTLRPLEKAVDGRIEGKEKTKQKEGDDKRGDKRKDREKNDQGKDKEKKKEEKANMKSEHRNIEKDTVKDTSKDDLEGINNIKTLHLSKEREKNAVSEANLRKRREFESNGFCHASDIKPNKLPRPSSSLHQSTETDKLPRPTSSLHPVVETDKLPRPTSSSHSSMGNGMTLESCQASSLVSSDSQGAACNHKADGKECRVNGIIVSQPLSVSTAKPLLTTAQADQIAEASTKPPHPDTKYLSQILLIPKMEEWLDFDDQEWLFNNSYSQLKTPKVGSFRDDEMPHVWAEAMRIESADVCALPYVIPF